MTSPHRNQDGDTYTPSTPPESSRDSELPHLDLGQGDQRRQIWLDRLDHEPITGLERAAGWGLVLAALYALYLFLTH